MELQEWQGYVTKIATCDYPLPSYMISDYDNWHCRSIVGRMLWILKDVEGAMAVLNTVKDVEVDMDDAPEMGLSDAEHKVLCLRDIAEIVWQLTGMGSASLYYLHEADKLCREYKHIFRSADRGRIWVRRLEILSDSGEGEKATAEAHAALEAEKGKEGINSYIFYAYRFLAEDAALKEEYLKACELLQMAYKHFPVTEAAERDIANALAIADPKERYEAFHHCTTIQYQPWERGNVPTLEDVRRLQDEKYRERQAKDEASKAAEMLNKL